MIRVYGFEEDPFFLPTFLTPRIYVLDYSRKRFAPDFEHFPKYKNSITFKLPYKIGPFSRKSRKVKEIANDLLKDMKFQEGEKMHYDPYQMISEKRKKIKTFIREILRSKMGLLKEIIK